MSNPLFFEEDLPDNITSKYEAVVIVGMRACELQKGLKSMVEGSERHKPTTRAMMELLQDKISFERNKGYKKIEFPEQEPLS